VRALVVQAVVERFANDTPLHCEIAAAAQIVRAVYRPTQGAMINDCHVDVLRVESIVAALGPDRFILIPKAKAQVTHDHVGRVLNLKSEIS